MSRLDGVRYRIGALLQRSRHAREREREMQFHLELDVAQREHAGRGTLSHRDAEYAARRRFGNVTYLREEARLMSAFAWLDTIERDVRFALRTMRRAPGITAVITLSLALGIGINATIYSLIDAVLNRTLPVRDPDGLVIVGDPAYVYSRGHGTPDGQSYSYPLYLDLRRSAHAFEGLAAVGETGRVDARIGGTSIDAEHPIGRAVSGNYFAVLGVGAAVGRTFDSTADDPGAPPQATISYDYWVRRFGKDPAIVGRDIQVDGVRLTITGVTMRGFTGEVVGQSTDIFVPVGLNDRLHPNLPVLRDRRAMWLLLFGRARPGLTLEQVRAQTTPLVRSTILAIARPDEVAEITDRGFTIAFASGARGLSGLRETFRAPLITLMLGVVVLLCIVLVNVANMLLARGLARRREISLRLALGADHGRVVRQLLTESAVLAVLSGALAVVVAWWGSRTLLVMALDGGASALDVGPNAHVIAFTLAVSMASALLFGLMPARRASRIDLASVLRATGRSIAHSARFGTVLITCQVALSLLLLVGASILTRSLLKTESLPLGFDRSHLIAGDLDIATPGYASDRLASAVHALRQRLLSVPGVADVSYSQNGIFSGSEWHTDVGVAGLTLTMRDSSTAADKVGSGYAHTIGARLIAGRDFGPEDEGVPPATALINESFARFYFHGANPIGRLVQFDDSSVLRVVGEIADVRGQSLDTTGTSGAARRIYMPYLYRSGTTKFPQPTELRLLVRTTGDPARALQAVRRAIVATDPAITIDDLESVTQLVRFSIRDERLVAGLATGLGALALVLAAIGLFGVMSYSVGRRTNEIGVRSALGADRSTIAWMVLRDGLRPVAIGVLLGFPLSIAAVRLLQHHLNDISSDPGSIAVAVGVLLAAAVAAVLVPARRATRIDPIGALREE
ncbi:MAG TPA: ABC transporter permease [Gemmatimonadaceae bacterium]